MPLDIVLIAHVYYKDDYYTHDQYRKDRIIFTSAFKY